MYCPRCGHQPISNELRFCSYCGFKLGVIKASLAEYEEEKASTSANAEPVNTPPRHRNINIGVITMFLGSLLAILISGRPGSIGREGGALLLTAFFAVTLLSSCHIIKTIYKLLSWGEIPTDRLPTSRRELGFGATLMYVGTALSAMISFLIAGRTKTAALPISVLVLFSVLLVISPYLLRALRYLIRDESNESTNLIAGGNLFSERALPPAHEFPIASIESPRVTTAEIGLPVPSVTEQTTGLLRGKSHDV